MLFTTELVVAAHSTILQVDIGLEMAILAGDAVQPLDLGINAFVLLELVVLLQPTRMLEKSVSLRSRRRNLFVSTSEGQLNVELRK
ncbi:hypothetical protein D3C76_1181830 [compost metagenome]